MGAIIGPRDLPKLGRILGRLSGKSIKFMYELKTMLSKANDSEVIKVNFLIIEA